MKNIEDGFKDRSDTNRTHESENMSKETIQNSTEETKCRKYKIKSKRPR